MGNTILIYLDGSSEAETVLPFVVKLASAAAGKIVLLSTTGAYKKGNAQMAGSLEQIAARLIAQFNGTRARMTVRTIASADDPVNSILNVSKLYSVSEIVLSSHVARSLKHSLLKASSVPVLIFQDSKTSGASYFQALTRPVLVPVSGSASSEAALPYAMDIAKAANVPLILLNIVPSLQEMILTNAFVGGQAWIMFPNHILDAQQAVLDQVAHQYLARLRSQCVQADWEKVLVRYEHGNAVHGILRSIEAFDPGLIVMTSHHRSSLQRLIAPSIPESILCCTERAVLVVNAPSGSGNEHSVHMQRRRTPDNSTTMRRAG